MQARLEDILEVSLHFWHDNLGVSVHYIIQAHIVRLPRSRKINENIYSSTTIVNDLDRQRGREYFC